MLHLDFDLILASKSTRLDYGTEGIEIEALKKTPILATKIPENSSTVLFEKFTNMTMKTHNKNLHPRSLKMDIQDTPITLQKNWLFF